MGLNPEKQLPAGWRSCVAAPLSCLHVPFWGANERGDSRFQLFYYSSVLLAINVPVEEISGDTDSRYHLRKT